MDRAEAERRMKPVDSSFSSRGVTLVQSCSRLRLSLAILLPILSFAMTASLAARAAEPGSSGAPAAAAADDHGTVTNGSGLFEQSLSAPAAATPAAPGTTATPAAPATAPPFTWSGYARGDFYGGKEPGSDAANMKAAYGELSLKVTSAKETYGDAFAEVRARYGLQGDQQQLFPELREAYVNGYLGPVSLRLGQQIIVWGRADAFNPTNNITPFDLRIRSPIEDDRRVGNVGARAFVNFAPFRLEGVWMPLYVPSELPSVYLPSFVSYGPTNFPRPELQNGLEAARLHLELPAFDASVSYLYGFAPLPGIALSSLTLDVNNPSVQVARTAYNQHVGGMDFSTTVGDLLAIRGEAAFRWPMNYGAKVFAARPDVQYVLGVDRSFGSVNVIAQYMGRYVIDWKQENGPDVPVNEAALMIPTSALAVEQATYEINLDLAKINQMLFSQLAQVQHLATLRVEWLTAHDTLSLSALGMVNFTTQEWLAAPKIGYRFSDAITAYAGAEIFGGPVGTLFGLIAAELSAGYVELRLTF
jgi:hypothetical protein